ncbi:hypothetical protein Bca101_101214 [Brassica carinata]
MTIRQYAYQHVGPSRGLSVGDIRPRGLSVGDFRPRGLSVSTHISTLALPVDYPWVIFAHEDCPWVIFAYEDCPWVIFAHEDCPSVRISARWPFPWTVRVIFAHEDCPSVRISARWPFPWTIRGDCRPRGRSVGDFRTRGLSVGDFRQRGRSVFTLLSTLALPGDCPGDFRPRGLSVSTHISTLALPVDYPWVIFAHEDCPWVIFAYEDCPWVIFAHEDCPSHVGPSRGLSVGDFRPRRMSVGDFRLRGLSVGDFRPRGLSVSTHNSTFTLPVDCPGAFRPRGQYISTHIGTLALPVDCSGDFRPRGLSVSRQLCTDGKSTWTVWVIFAHEDCPLVHISARWPFPWTVFGQLTHVDSPSAKRTEGMNYIKPAAMIPVDTTVNESSFGNDEAFGYLKRVIVTPAAYRAWLNFFTLTFRALGRNHIALASARTIAMLSPERAAPSPPPPTRGGPLATLAAQAARQQSTGSNWDPEPSPQSQSFSGYGSILPTSLPTLFHRPEAVHLGDLMRYEYDRA